MVRRAGRCLAPGIMRGHPACGVGRGRVRTGRRPSHSDCAAAQFSGPGAGLSDLLRTAYGLSNIYISRRSRRMTISSKWCVCLPGSNPFGRGRLGRRQALQATGMVSLLPSRPFCSEPGASPRRSPLPGPPRLWTVFRFASSRTTTRTGTAFRLRRRA